MIILRKLQLKDVPLMLEWMHDEEAKHIFQNNFAEIDDVAAKKFVENSFREDQQHFAIVDDQDDEYLGIHIRSSLAFKKHLNLVNSQGVIDADYYNNEDNEGHIMIGLINFGNEDVEITKDMRIAQAIFYKFLIIDDEKKVDTIRSGGFGSTGE